MKLWLYIFLVPLFCLGQDNVGILDGPISKPLLEDTFATPLAAGSVNGTYSTGRAPGLRTVVDAGNKISIQSSNTVLFTGSGSYISYPSIASVSGRVLTSKMDSGASGDNAFWFSDAQGTLNGFGLDIDGPTAKLYYHNTGASAPAIASTSSTVLYNTYLVLRGSGAFAFIKGGAFTNPTLLFSDTTLDSSAKYVVLSNGRAANCFFGPILVPKTLWLPSPIASDSFVRANGALGVTDGSGTQERNGGAGLTWNAPGWVVSGNTAIAGNTVVADGVTSGLVGRWQLDTATGLTDLSGSGNNGTGHGGITVGGAVDRRAIANRATTFISGSSQYVSILPIYTTTGYSVSLWALVTNPGSSPIILANGHTLSNNPWFVIQSSPGGNCEVSVKTDSNVLLFDKLSSSTPFSSALFHHIVWTDNNGVAALYIDGIKDSVNFNYTPGVLTLDVGDVGVLQRAGFTGYLSGSMCDVRNYTRAISSAEVQAIYRAGATALCTNSTANVVAETSFTGSTSPSGLVLNYDGATGTNGLFVYFDGNGNVKADEMVNGLTTNRLTGAVTYVANARLQAVSAPSENQVRVYYNNSFVNSYTGPWAGFANFTQHGLYSQGSGSFTNLANFARGTEGQYSIIDKLP